MFSCRYTVCNHQKIVLMPTLYYRMWARKAPISIRQHLVTSCTKVFWCDFYAPQCTEM